ncbi:hypothetical protein TRICI_000468 [Trichomonascus ciferrii]|uniref:GATA-type domain-containing protein n=1 Tax=Trichomonascus ciferrii TaxID=44093 RepID=A0A642VDB8_9ASCO|nr:hypothetical protein TRICI_000468 [Trichomonascus ciferrii]
MSQPSSISTTHAQPASPPPVELFRSMELAPSTDDEATPRSLASLYPDTAPRALWRPQLQSWLRRHHPTKLRELSSSETSPNHHQNSSSSNHRRVPSAHSDKPYARPSSASTSPSSDREFATTPIYHPILNPSPNYAAISPRLPSPPPESPEDKSTTGRRRCISCGSDQSPCWRPSWSTTAGQLCNSCGLRYKKTGARCVAPNCGRIPAKGEWVAMKRHAAAGNHPKYSCLACGGLVEVGAEKSDD